MYDGEDNDDPGPPGLDEELPEVAPARPLVPARPREAETRVDLLYRYMREVQRHPLLTPDEEKELTLAYSRTKDPKIAYRLVSANLRLVVKIAFEYRTFTHQVLDLIQEGNMGLIQAVKHFDPLRGVRLSHYAQYWIRSYIIYYLLNNHRIVKLGTTQAQRKVFFNLRRERQRLLAMGFDPTPRLIAANLDVPESTVTEMMERMGSPDLYLEAPLDADGSRTLMGTLAGGSDPVEETASAEVGERLRQKIDEFGRSLTAERDRFIWEHRLMSEEPITLQEIGEKYGVSRERARQLEERIKKNFKDFLRKELGDDYIETEVLRR